MDRPGVTLPADSHLLGGAIKRTPQRLAIYRYHTAHRHRKALHPGDETTLELLRVQPREHVPLFPGDEQAVVDAAREAGQTVRFGALVAVAVGGVAGW